jgi:hypothetical protein
LDGREGELRENLVSPDPAPPEPLPVGYVLHDRYTIEAELAPQSMGRLYRAFCLFSDGHREVCAVNVLALELRNTEGIRRFRSAFRKAFYRHRGHVYEYGEYLGVLYAVMEYLEGTAVVDIGQDS